MKNNIIFGSSGSTIEVEELNIIKSSTNVERFEKQIQKQINFVQQGHFCTPNIKSFSYENQNLKCVMEYIQGLDCINYFNQVDRATLVNIAKNFFFYIDKNINNSKNMFIDKKIFFDKLETLDIDSSLKVQALTYLDKIKDKKFLIPIGECHGDFTFTNMIFQNNKIYLLDFLDCYIETPFQDIVKLKQETSYFWSIIEHKYKTNENINYSKVAISYSFLDTMIDEHYKNYDWYNKFYELFQLINLCRILPYVTIPQIKIHIEHSIKKILR